MVSPCATKLLTMILVPGYDLFPQNQICPEDDGKCLFLKAINRMGVYISQTQVKH